jgi:catechol 2,3-dioxygenase-like lactoylglutathione lyase family enzyme
VANQNGRPVVSVRKLLAWVLGAFAGFVMVFGAGLRSWAIVVLGLALLALAVALGMVNVVRRGARAWVTGTAEVRAVSPPPRSGVYGRCELQLLVFAPGLPESTVTARASQVPVTKWPRVEDILPIVVDIDDMRRLKIQWDQVEPHEEAAGATPAAHAEPADEEQADDDLLADPEPPPWLGRDEWTRDGEQTVDMAGRPEVPVIVRDTPDGPVVDNVPFRQDAGPPPKLAQRATRAARPPGWKPSPHPTANADDGTVTASPTAAPPPPGAGPPTDPLAAAGEPPPPPADAPAPPDDAVRPPAGSPPQPPAGSPPQAPPQRSGPARSAEAAAAAAGTAAAAARPTAADRPATGAVPGPRHAPHEPQHAAAGTGGPPRGPAEPQHVPLQPRHAATATAGPAEPRRAVDADAPPGNADDDIDLALGTDDEPTSPTAAQPVSPAATASPGATPSVAPRGPSRTAGAAPAPPPAAANASGATTAAPGAPEAATPPVEADAGATAESPHPPPDRAEDPAIQRPVITGVDVAPPTVTAGAEAPPATGDPAAATVSATAPVAPTARAETPAAPTATGTARVPGTASTAAAPPGPRGPAADDEDDDVDEDDVDEDDVDEDEDDDEQDDGGHGGWRSPWADLGSGFTPEDRADEVITAYPSARPGPSGAIYGVGATVLVTSLDRSVAFYRDVLGFFEIDGGPGNAVLASGDTRVVLRTVRDTAAAPTRPMSLNLEVGDVAAVYRELRRKGVTFVHAPRPVNRGEKLELWAAAFHDPDGHNIAVTQWRPAP